MWGLSEPLSSLWKSHLGTYLLIWRRDAIFQARASDTRMKYLVKTDIVDTFSHVLEKSRTEQGRSAVHFVMDCLRTASFLKGHHVA